MDSGEVFIKAHSEKAGASGNVQKCCMRRHLVHAIQAALAVILTFTVHSNQLGNRAGQTVGHKDGSIYLGIPATVTTIDACLGEPVTRNARLSVLHISDEKYNCLLRTASSLVNIRTEYQRYML